MQNILGIFLPESSLMAMPSLRRLHLNGLRTTESQLPMSFMSCLSGLQTLALVDNELSAVLPSLRVLKQLHSLNLKDNDLQLSGEGVEMLSSLPALRELLLGSTTPDPAAKPWTSKSMKGLLALKGNRPSLVIMID